MPQPVVERAAANFLSYRRARRHERLFLLRVCTSVTIPAHFLTAINRIDNFILGKEFVGEDRGLDRILRRLKLHAEGRQFGGPNS